VKYAVLGLLGRTRLVPSWHLLAIASPPGCHAADAIDWLPVWESDSRG
jgi:hypothetical protein